MTTLLSKTKVQYKIYKIWDNEGESLDRYTVTFKYLSGKKYKKLMASYNLLECLCLSDNCNMPNGISQFSSCQEGNHLGKEILFDNLPENVKMNIRNRMFQD